MASLDLNRHTQVRKLLSSHGSRPATLHDPLHEVPRNALRVGFRLDEDVLQTIAASAFVRIKTTAAIRHDYREKTWSSNVLPMAAMRLFPYFSAP